jgi:hypothetical protein
MQMTGNLSQAPAICIQFHRLPSNAFGVALFFGFGRVLTITVHTAITLHACFRRPRFVLAGCLLAIWTRCHGSLSPLFWTFSFLGLSSAHSFGHLAGLLGRTDIFSRNAIKCQEGNFPVCNGFHMDMKKNRRPLLIACLLLLERAIGNRGTGRNQYGSASCCWWSRSTRS